MRLTDRATIGFTKCRKNPSTMPTRQSAITSMISRSLPKTERWRGGFVGGLVIVAADEPVAEAAHGLDEGRLAGVVTELLAQARDEDVDRPVEGFPVEAARGLHDPVPGQGRPAAADAEAPQRGHRRGQPH